MFTSVVCKGGGGSHVVFTSVVCKGGGGSHVVFTLFVCLRIVMSNTYCVVFLFVLCRFSRLAICYCPFGFL